MINDFKQKKSADPIRGLAERFNCPITQAIMQDPVMASDGFTYERAAIEEWIRIRGARALSPTTGEHLVHLELAPNISFRNMIKEYLEHKPQIKQKRLTEQDIHLAIGLREEEIQHILEKQVRQVNIAQAERNEVAQQLGPMERENAQLRAENQELNAQAARSQTLLANAVLDGGDRVDLPIDATLRQHLLRISQLEAEIAEQKKQRAANIIKQAIGQRGIRKLTKSSHLQETKEALLHKKAVGKEAFKKENSALQEHMEQLARQQNWKGISQLGAQAQTKETDFAQQEQELDHQLADLAQAKAGKRHAVERRADRLAGINEQTIVQKQNIAQHIEEQGQQAENLTNYLKKQLPNIPETAFFAKKPSAKPIQPPVDPRQVQQLLTLVVEGQQDEAKALLKQTPALGCAMGDVTDLSARTFKGITAFQYAVWARDWHMWTMLLKYLPQAAAREQCLVFQDNTASWIQHHGKYFDLNPLINALQTFVNQYQSWDNAKRENYWGKTIGGLQRDLPVHVINEYDRPDRSFDSVPNFRETTLPRGRVVMSVNYHRGLRVCEGWDEVGVGVAVLGGFTGMAPRPLVGNGLYCLAWPTVGQLCRVVCDQYCALGSCDTTRAKQAEELFTSLDLTPNAGTVKPK